MRFVSAIVAFVLAAGMIAYGIAQHTVLAPADRLTSSVTTGADAPFTLIDGAVLNSNAGQQRLAVSGADTVFVAYGRTTDVVAWLGDQTYNSVGYDAKTQALVSSVVTPTDAGGAEEESTGPTPAGSDLWLEERQNPDSLDWTVNVPVDVSVLIAADGTLPAPAEISLSWPLEHETPWAAPLIIGGGVLLLVGLALYIWGLVHMRKARGPRRKSPPRAPKLPQAPRPRVTRARVLEPETTAKGRRSTRRFVALTSLVVVSGLALSACSTVGDILEGSPAPVPSESASAQPAEVTPVAVTEGQLLRIVDRVSTTVTQADNDRNLDLLKTRMTGPALEQRQANYTMRGADSGIKGPDPIPSTPVKIELPQATDAWPRSILTVVGGDDPSVAPVALVLTQQTPRDNYLVTYTVQLQPGIEFPAVAPVTVGAAVLQNDVKLLALQPDQVAPDYADILLQGDASPSVGLFQADPDKLRTDVGVDYKNAQKAALPKTAAMDFVSGPGTGPVYALATVDSGAIVATTVVERQTTKPVEEGAKINLQGSVKALSGLTTTEKGIESSYSYQLVFYVPPGSDAGKVVLLGYAQGLIGVREL